MVAITGKTKLTMILTGTSTTVASTAFKNMTQILITPSPPSSNMQIRKLNSFWTTLIAMIIIPWVMME